jgi:hypothetical protein
MAQNWLTSPMLPTKYWFFAIKRACKVSNLLPVKQNGKLTTLYELVYSKKVNYHSLLPMFSVAYIKQQQIHGQDKNSWSSKSLNKCILVGKCDKSDSLLFHHPPSKQTLSCADGYRFDPHVVAGQHFKLYFEADFIFHTKSAMENIHCLSTHEEKQKCILQAKLQANI